MNPLVLDALVLAGYDRPFDVMEATSSYPGDFAGVDESSGTARQFPLPSPMDVIVDAEEHSVRMPAGRGLDFGGVAKGWAAHQAMERLSVNGPALVSVGGDVAVSGPHASGDPWRIGVEDPAQRDRYLETIYLERGGVATSGKDHRHWQRGGVFQHHIIDPRTRMPAQTDILAATVVASSVMRAEALAKAVLIAGSEAGLPLLEAHADAEAVLVLDDGRLMYSRNIGDYL